MPNKGVVRPVKQIVKHSGDPGYVNRVLIGTPTEGTIRVEWHNARVGALVPCNWSQVNMMQYMNSYIPVQYQVADAQNLIVKATLEGDFEWMFLLEDDNLLPGNAFVILNQYLRKADVPIVSGLYFTKSTPPEPLIYRGRGNSYYGDFKMGEKVWADGVPTGCLLVHHSILKVMWNESPEYTLHNGEKTREVFRTPRDVWFDEDTAQYNTTSGTSDLDWCTRIVKDKIFKKAGWPEYQKKKYPFLVDTNLFTSHIDRITGLQYPQQSYIEMQEWRDNK